MVLSASAPSALSKTSKSYTYFVRQFAFAVIGIGIMLFISKIDYRVYKKFSYLFFIISLILLAAVLIPNVGVEVNGATRWLGFGETFRFQPSEIVKISLVFAISTYIATNYKKTNSIRGYIIPFLMLAVVVIIMFLQNHMSGTLVMMVAALSIIFAIVIKIKLRYIIPLIIIAVVALGIFILAEPFRINRILSFANPEQDIKDGNWQAAQSLYAIGSGGLFGRGLGQSREKYSWLPEAQNDFIFSVLCEELGLVGAVIVLGMFIFFIYRGYKIALTCKDMYGSLIATGITSVFAIQILVNIAVVTCTMPVTGMPLPFFSYGGTALCINLCAMGILLSISRNCKTN